MTDTCFAPLASAHARVLILGTLPGQESLRRQQYYAHPNNAFWKIMGRLFGAGPELPYEERALRLIQCDIAVWDVCAAAERPGSLDTAIVQSSVVPNDFSSFFETHPDVGLIGFNGAKAAALYRRMVLPGLHDRLATIRSAILPSTSPAYAAMSLEEKAMRWNVIGERNAR